jgi:hypothetical protein
MMIVVQDIPGDREHGDPHRAFEIADGGTVGAKDLQATRRNCLLQEVRQDAPADMAAVSAIGEGRYSDAIADWGEKASRP